VVKGKGFQGYKRKDFRWGPQELRQALQKGRIVKHRRVITFKDVCIKIRQRQFLHQDRCLASWKMSRALEVRGIPVPRSLGYFVIDGDSFFLSEYLADSMTLNDYLSSLTSELKKRRALKKLASWLKEIHGHNIWQRDFKSSNVLCQNDNYQMVDLDGVKICRHLPEKSRIINLAQLNASLSNAITIRDRLRFYYYYKAAERPSRQHRRAIYRKVLAISTGKNTSIYGLDITKLKF
jgi:tRNA A-37 threonylcarbamoyl transferase component Bud32